MIVFPYIFLFIFGTIVGSFLNVVILRFNTGMGVATGRSACFSCGKTLSWYELVPVISFCAQWGRCRGCNSKVSFQYPLVEIAIGLAFALAFYMVPGAFVTILGTALFVLLGVLFCLYTVIFVYDLKHKIIPDAFSYAAALVGIAMIGLDWYMSGVFGFSFDFTRVIAGPAFFLFFFIFWFVSKGTWMGLGDAKLALSVGWVLGLWQGIAALLLAFWIGAIVALGIIAFQKVRTFIKKGSSSRVLGMRSEIPFGPFILIGFIVSFLFHLDFVTLLSYLAV